MTGLAARWLAGPALGLCAMGAAWGADLVLENDSLRATFNAESATLVALDKRNGYEWRQSADILPDLPSVRAIDATLADGAITARLSGAELSGLRIEIDPDDATLYLTIESEHGSGYEGPLPGFPYPFVMEEDSGYVVQCTMGDGMIFPMRELDRMIRPFNLDGGMPWYGVTDLEKGCIVTLTSFRHFFASSGGAARYPLEIRCHFTTEGGYVALAKHYRRIAALQGKTATLAQKMTQLPDMARMRAAPIIYLWGEARRPEFIQGLKEAGIERAMTLWDLNHPPGPTGALVDAAHEAGYLPGPYDIYLAIMNPATGWAKKALVFDTDRRLWPQGWPEALINYVPGVAPEERATPESAYVCASFLPGWSRERIAEELRHFNYKVRFFDTNITQARPCDSPLHPMTHVETVDARREVLRQAMQDLGQITGSGEGYSPDWAVPYLCWMEGPMSMRHYVTPYMNSPGRLEDGREDWRNETEPAAVVMDAEPDETFRQFEVNPAYRLPLYGLVYHDCLVTSWNWRGANHRIIGGQREKDLMNVLFGTPPLWSLTPDGWESKKDVLVQSYREVCGWLENVAFDEMTDHRWLSEDRMVAATSFSSGWNVAVNMTDEDFESEHGVVKAKSFLTWKSD